MAGRIPGRSRMGGFSYLIVLFAVALAGTAMAGVGMSWHTAQQREKERELLFIGNQIRAAIASYLVRGPGGAPRYPATLEDLVKDPRFPVPVRHLRKIYRDPMTGKAEWGLIAAPGGGIMGVYSVSEAAPLKRSGFDAPNLVFEERTKALGDKMTYKEWQFVHLANSLSQIRFAPAASGATARP